MTKHIFVTGGVVSSLGKGLTSASIGMLLEARGLSVRMQKLDPYINVDPGTMSPYQHGEVYVLDDGSETDLDLGHYERFTNSPLTRDSNYTTGQIYQSVINKERRGEFLGKTVQVIPHITNEIKGVIRKLADDDVDVVITEIGGTVGDIESQPFLEAIRQFSLDVGKGNCLYIHLTLVPVSQSGRRVEDQADAAFRRPVAADRHPARRADLPHRAAAGPRRSRQDRPVLQRADRSGDRGARQGFFDLRGAAEPGRQPARRIDRPPARTAGGATRTWRIGAICCIACAIRSMKSRSPSSANMPSIATPTSRSMKRSTTPASPIGAQVRIQSIQSEACRARRAGAAALGIRRHSRAGRLWRAGHRGQGASDSLRPRARDSVFRHLPGDAMRGDRIRPQCGRAGRGPFDRVQQRHAPSGDLPCSTSRSRSPTKGGTMRLGAQQALLSRRQPSPSLLRPRRDSRAASASLRIQQRLSAAIRGARDARGRPPAPTASWSRSSNCPSIRGLWPCSFIRNSSRSRRRPSRCLPDLWRRRWCGMNFAGKDPVGS